MLLLLLFPQRLPLPPRKNKQTRQDKKNTCIMATLLVWVISQWHLNAHIFTTPLCLEISGNICVCLHEYVFVTVTSSSGPWPFNLYLSEPSPPPALSSLAATPPSGGQTGDFYSTLLAPSGARVYCIHLMLGRRRGEMENCLQVAFAPN